ncbi:unnamed protein product [Haemonchus placei]|uniref:Fructose-bisphosphate aldolase class I n=1 Tax=Haemonchus placei TaxID=6290 RepID=A0A0N4WWJ5_HAEPC|nr:unnamed protein product [Haemonchus placei]
MHYSKSSSNVNVDVLLSESAPIRALARAVIRGGKTVQDKLGHTDAASRIEKFMKLYQEEYQKALKK